MSEPTKFIPSPPCGHCGQTRDVVSPEWLRWTRERAGVTIKYVAKAMGVSPTVLSHIEHGRRMPGRKVVAAYDVLRAAAPEPRP